MKSYLQNHPVLTFLGINFAWTWLFWLGAIPLRSDRLLLTALVMICGFGPALAGVLTLGFSAPRRPTGINFKRLWAGLGFAGLLLAVFAVRYAVGNIPALDALADDLRLTVPVLAAAAACQRASGGGQADRAISWEPPQLLLRAGAMNHPQEAGPLACLTAAELKVAQLVVNGLSYKEVARQLKRSLSTVDHQLRSIREKTGAASTAALIHLLSRATGD